MVKIPVLVTSKTGKQFIQYREAAQVTPYRITPTEQKTLTTIKNKTKKILKEAQIPLDKLGKFDVVEVPEGYLPSNVPAQVEIFNNKAQIRIGSKTQDRLLTSVHEVGHLLDSRLGLSNDPKIMKELYATPMAKGLVQLFAQNKSPYYAELLKPHEMFARTFGAYLAYKTKNLSLIKDLKKQEEVHPEHSVDLTPELVQAIEEKLKE